MKTKKLISMCLCLLLITGISAHAAETDGKKTDFYLNYGSVTIGENSVSGYDSKGQKVTVPDADGYRIRQSNNQFATQNNITVESARADIELDGINIDCSDVFGTAAFMIDGSSMVNITLKRNNFLSGGESKAGLEIGTFAETVIDGDGSLKVVSKNGAAAIGGGGTNPCGVLVINGGYIVADGSGSSSGAGIGGGCNASGGTITINGGYVEAVGGEYSAGIGGGGSAGAGGNITINGGTVTATGGIYAAGIGGGRVGKCASVIIGGGSVKAVAGKNCKNAIGGGYGRPAAEITDSSGNKMTCVKIDAEAGKGDLSLKLDGKMTGIRYAHPDDGCLYLYLKDGEYSALVTSRYSKSAYFTITVNNPDFTAEKTLAEMLALADGSALSLSGKLLKGDFSSVGNIKSQFTNSESKLFLTDENGIETDDFEKFATGQVITLKSGGDELDRAEIVISGDADCDGEINAADAVIAQAIQTGILTNCGAAVLSAADADGNGTIDDADITILINAGLKK